MRPLPAALALSLALAVPAAARADLPRGAAESNASYACRMQLTPDSRNCLAHCEAAFRAAEQEDERWSCVQACTTEHVRAVRACREEATATARALQRDDGADEDGTIAFDPARLTD